MDISLNNLKNARKIVIVKLVLFTVVIVAWAIFSTLLSLTENSNRLIVFSNFALAFVVFFILLFFWFLLVSKVKAGLTKEFQNMFPQSKELYKLARYSIFFGGVLDVVFLFKLRAVIKKTENMLNQQTVKNEQTTIVSKRLWKLDQLRRSGDVDREEYQKIRQKILSEI